MDDWWNNHEYFFKQISWTEFAVYILEDKKTLYFSVELVFST